MQSSGPFSAAVAANFAWLAAVSIAASVISAYYYIMIVKLMYFDEPAPAFAATRDRGGGFIILVSALIVSPLGYLAWNALDLATLATIYLGAQIIRQVPLTPGGIGLIETGLLAGLTSAGAPAAAAAATVLTYRVLSNWVIVPIGGLAWFGLRRPPAPHRPPRNARARGSRSGNGSARQSARSAISGSTRDARRAGT